MSKAIYYFGAGASAGKRNKQGLILEGLPVVSEIPERFELFRESISNAQIPDGDINFWNRFLTTSNNVERNKEDMLNDIDFLIKGIQSHATIDTYARKLYLTGNEKGFEKLKDVLCAFFIWEQIMNYPDNRYDTFLANVLEMPYLDIPRDISILSWNYDSQIEMAFRSYRERPGLIVFEKNRESKWPALTDTGRIIKLNGSATFADSLIITNIMEDKLLSVALQLIIIYSHIKVTLSGLGIHFNTHLSFAWEDSPNQENMLNTIKSTTEDTEYVVVIGYSFPFFNRQTDRLIFGGMQRLRKIYVQDMNADAVIQSMKAVLPADIHVDIVPINNCEQFFLPGEL